MIIEAPSYAQLYLFIGGERIDARARERLSVINPATGERIGDLPVATDGDLQRALAAAERGFARWRSVSAFDRARILHGAAALVRERAENIARTMTTEQGKVLVESRAEVVACAELFDWVAEEGRRAYGRVVPSRSPVIRQLVLREPVGPVAAFTPWNFPAITPARKLAGALGAGCSIVIKPAEETPATALALLEALLDAGVEPEAVSMLFGDPAHISKTLIASPIVRKVSFTGSIAVGKQLAHLAADGTKRMTLELGGHAPVIVSEHADLARAVNMSVAAKYRNAGQVCVSPSRFIVHRSIYDAFVDRFTAKAAGLRIGNGLDEQTQMASLANERRRSGIDALVRDALERGATARTGGGAIDGPGFFYQATVLTDLPADTRVLHEEPFGPVAAITAFDTLEEAIAEANRLPYGLSAYAFTQDLAESIAISERVETGMLGINHFGIALAELPFGGVKASGYGSEGGTEGLDSYTVTKSVTMA